MSETTSSSTLAARSRGRPREFDMNEALDKALLVFSDRGYHATSIGNLTEAMQLASGSVYKAFKDKRGVFLAVFDRYRAIRSGKLRATVETGKPGYDRIRDALTFFADASHGIQGKRGCLVVNCATELATFDPEVAEKVATAMATNEAVLLELIEQGRKDGSVPAHIDGKVTARMMLCLVQGMRVVGKTGRTREEMVATVDVAMKTLI
ncbi:TetR/AcrR family transcriptional regulator [Phyllobacterium sp. P30BS-XVII]|uniref:TetR/AcrR family transcriptional regulator n=1 Tax=Phyllobacterium sp. P30BS-XVII TaxID=2587046 RepID=UPI000DDAF3BE|nr:TetR/AcrR family transcriptional regulator [Phyllobacterium sp. P30BS-XVII]MBA8900693.1 AcrR family transcriptional regulator [Phyllobacterium sp. P30BS-XVII]